MPPESRAVREPRSALVIHPRLRACGGAERACLEFIRILTGAGYRVSLLSLDTPEELAEIARHLPRHAATLAGVASCPVPEPIRQAFRRLALERYAFAYSLLLLVLLARNREHDLLLSTCGELSLHPLFVRPGSMCLAYINYPLFWTRSRDRVAAGWRDRGPLGNLATGLAVRLLRRVFAIDEMPARTVVMANSAWTAQRTAELYPGLRRIHVVYGPAPAAASLPPGPRGRRHDGIWRFICLGRIAPAKRQGMLARCLQGLFAGRPDDFRLTIIGYGSEDDLEPLRRQLGGDPRIRLIPNADEEQVTASLAAADLGLHGHPCEHFGLAVAQMVDAGLPVFVPADGGQTEIVPIPELHYVSPDDLAGRIEAVLDDEALRARIEARMAALHGRFSTDLFSARVAAVLVQSHGSSCARALRAASDRDAPTDLRS